MWRRWVVNLGLVIGSLAVFLGGLEWLLTAGAFNDLSIHWFPPEYKELNERISKPNVLRSGRHPYIFNGPIAGFKKSDRYKARILVVGDSFVWGKSLPWNQVWVQKFRNRVAEVAPGIEVVGWGLNGWSTIDQLEFMENVAKHHGGFEADILIVSFVVNDPSLVKAGRDNQKKRINWKGTPLVGLRRVLPNTFDFVTGHIDAALEFVTDEYGHGNWVRDIWSDENLAGYRDLLRRLKAFLDESGIPVVFAFMPATPDTDYYQPKFRKMATVLDELGIAYMDNLPRIVEAFGHGDYGRNYRKLWATPGDSHPGDAVTSVLAEGVLDYLQRDGVLGRLSGKTPISITARLDAMPACEAERRIVAHVVGFDRYPMAEGRPYLRVQGLGYESDEQSFRPLKNVYLSIGENYFPATTRLALNVSMQDGERILFNGWYAIDVPADDVSAPVLNGIVAVADSGCRVSRPFRPPMQPSDRVPPPLEKPPTVPIGMLRKFSQ